MLIPCGTSRDDVQSPIRGLAVVVSVVALISSPCCFGQTMSPQQYPSPNAFQSPAPSLDSLRDELKRLLDEQTRVRGNQGEGNRGPLFRQLEARAQTLMRQLRTRSFSQLQERVVAEFGAVAPLSSESVELEALDSKGKKVGVTMNVLARPLRPLNVAEFSERTFNLLEADGLALSLYDTLPMAVSPTEVDVFRRAYVGDAAQALATEAKLVVTLKGGEWREPQDAPVANAIAVRGLDLDTGLHANGKKTYDDTMYIVTEAPGKPVEVYEYRMTTESSSTERGVGRLDSMQVVYVRGLHRGKDPGYRLKGDAAEGTREGIEGTQRILGANIHSAYAKRAIDSETPLSPNVSLGCQVVAASKKAFEQSLVSLLDDKGISEFPYTIVDGDELNLLNQALEARNKHSLLVLGIPRKTMPLSREDLSPSVSIRQSMAGSREVRLRVEN